jgi:hypothetical protein
MRLNDAFSGKRVRVVNLDYAAEIAPVGEQYLNARCLDITGTLQAAVRKHACRVWWVVHDKDDVVAPYCIHEMELLEEDHRVVVVPEVGAPLAKSIFD